MLSCLYKHNAQPVTSNYTLTFNKRMKNYKKNLKDITDCVFPLKHLWIRNILNYLHYSWATIFFDYSKPLVDYS
jgi:hypothetical protein